MKYTYRLALFLFFAIANGNAQNSDGLSAKQIIDNSIAYIGGEKAIAKISTLDLTYSYSDPEGAAVSIIEKRRVGKYFTQSILSMNHYPQTTFFDGENIVRVEKDSVKKVKASDMPEAKIKTFTHLQTGYQKLNFSYTRLKDEKFKNFDCYVVAAKNKEGYTTTNFFDKSTYKLQMVVYPNGNKSLMIKDSVYNGIKFNTQILNVDAGSNAISRFDLLDLKINPEISKIWFTPPHSAMISLPENIKYGRFKPADANSILTRNHTTQTETYGKEDIITQIEWKSEDTFILKSPEFKDGIIVRIIASNKDGYVCHFMTGNVVGSQEYKRIE